MDPRRKKQINKHVDKTYLVGVDNFGNELYTCFYTQKVVSIIDAVLVGSILPQSKTINICDKGYKEKYKESRRAFNDMDANCNTCKHLKRIKHEKDRAGFLHGICTKNNSDFTNYLGYIKENIMQFHPDDCMLQPCYEQI